LCCTYGRPQLLGEAVKCFIDQTYPNKELIVVNDQEGVTLKMDSERDDIQIHNVPLRFNSLGEKRNYGMSLIQGDYVCIWDDDDLYFPWRISESVKAIKKYNCDIVKANRAIMTVNNSNPKISQNLFHSQACITKDYISRRKYPLISVGEDIGFENGANIKSVDVDPFYWYVYRWGLNIHHLSGISNEKASWDKSLTFVPYSNIQGEIKIKAEFTKNHWTDMESFLNIKI